MELVWASDLRPAVPALRGVIVLLVNFDRFEGNF